MNSHSCAIASLPANRPTPIDRAGFTDVFVTGMLIRWIRVRRGRWPAGASPLGARLSVAPEDHPQEDRGQQHLDDQAGEQVVAHG